MVLILFGTDGLDVAAVQEAVKTITTGTLEYARGAARRAFFMPQLPPSLTVCPRARLSDLPIAGT